MDLNKQITELIDRFKKMNKKFDQRSKAQQKLIAELEEAKGELALCETELITYKEFLSVSHGANDTIRSQLTEANAAIRAMRDGMDEMWVLDGNLENHNEAIARAMEGE